MTPSKPAPAAQAAPAKPRPKRRVVRRRTYHYENRTAETADALNGEELRQSPIVASPPHPVAGPVYPAPAYYPPPGYYPPPPPPPYYPPPMYWHPY
jgi:hypothetical protein